jgi:hypothetical protein
MNESEAGCKNEWRTETKEGEREASEEAKELKEKIIKQRRVKEDEEAKKKEAGKNKCTMSERGEPLT